MDQQQRQPRNLLEMLLLGGLNHDPVSTQAAPIPPSQYGGGVGLPANQSGTFFGTPNDQSQMDQFYQQLEEQARAFEAARAQEQARVASLSNLVNAGAPPGPFNAPGATPSGAGQLAGISSYIPHSFPTSTPPRPGLPSGQPAATGVAFPPQGPMPDFHNLPAAGPPAPAAPSPQPPAPPPGPPIGAMGLPTGPVLINAQPQGGGPDTNVPFRPVNPQATPTNGPSPGNPTNIQQREINAGFPSAFVPMQNRTVLDLPSSQQPAAPSPQPAPVFAPQRTPIGPQGSPSGSAPPRPAPTARQPAADELNRAELQRFLASPGPTAAPPSPSTPTGPDLRTVPPTAPMPPNVPPTALPSGAGISQPKMGQVPEHLKDALLEEALRITRKNKGMAI